MISRLTVADTLTSPPLRVITSHFSGVVTIICVSIISCLLSCMSPVSSLTARPAYDKAVSHYAAAADAFKHSRAWRTTIILIRCLLAHANLQLHFIEPLKSPGNKVEGHCQHYLNFWSFTDDNRISQCTGRVPGPVSVKAISSNYHGSDTVFLDPDSPSLCDGRTMLLLVVNANIAEGKLATLTVPAPCPPGTSATAPAFPGAKKLIHRQHPRSRCDYLDCTALPAL